VNRFQVVAAALAIAAVVHFSGSGSGPSLSGVAGIAESFQRSRAAAQADTYESLAVRIDAGEFKDGSALGRETESLVAAAGEGHLGDLQASAKESLPEGGITDAAAVAAWYRAVAKGYRRVGGE
jgi:hypothetical protein